jgi:hypothetical protein
MGGAFYAPDTRREIAPSATSRELWDVTDGLWMGIDIFRRERSFSSLNDSALQRMLAS